jgi:hypothetical protein
MCFRVKTYFTTLWLMPKYAKFTNSFFVANLKLCFNIVRGHDEKTATN